MNTQTNKFIKLLWALFFFLMIFMPRQLQAVKVALMVMIFLSKAITHELYFSLDMSNTHIKMFILCWFSSAALRAVVGFINGNPGVLDTIQLDIIYIAILLLLFFTIDTREELEWINCTILVSGTICAIYTLIWFLVNIGIWPRNLFYAFDYTTGFGDHEGYIHMTNTNGSMLIPILPMFFVSFMTSERKGRKDIIKIIALFICALAAFLTGRRMIWASIPFALAFVFVIAIIHPQNVRYSFAGTNWKRLAIIVGSIVAIGIFLIARGYININSIISRFRAVLAGGEESSERSIQAEALIRGFLQHPVFGSGAGASAPGIIRNQDFTWAYELSYHAVLFQSGIVGFSLYVIALLSIAFGCVAGAKRKDKSYSSYVALLAGLLIGYIANASNPYFSSSFDFLWWIIWPAGYIYAEKKITEYEI